jgi:hypothetical protein
MALLLRREQLMALLLRRTGINIAGALEMQLLFR